MPRLIHSLLYPGILLGLLVSLAACATTSRALPPLELVPQLDAERYMGRWYEIARYQHSFEKDLVGVTAFYSLNANGTVKVLNSGFYKTLDGPYRQARAVARIPDASRPAALKVSFFWPFAGDYLVFGLDDQNYSWALVGDNSRGFLWFLARSPEISPQLLEQMKKLAQAQGFALDNLYLVPQKARAD